jgi:hypothetical protein
MLLPSLLKTKSQSSDHLVLLVGQGLQFDRFGTVASGDLGSLHRCQRDLLSRCYPKAALSISGIAALGGYREGRSELPEFEPAVVELSSSTISCTTLLSGSTSMIRSGSFTNSSCFASGT